MGAPMVEGAEEDVVMDQLESMEAAAEGWADANIVGDSFKCACGRMCKLEDGVASSPNPFSPPMCRECIGQEMQALSDERAKEDHEIARDGDWHGYYP